MYHRSGPEVGFEEIAIDLLRRLVARRDGTSLEDFTGKNAWVGARNIETVTDKEADLPSGALVSTVPFP
jgi:hypothetical protein